MVIRTYGYNDVLIADEYSYYFVSYGYGCTSYDFPEGGVVYVDTYYEPSFYNDIYVESIGGYETCTISDVDEIENPHPFYVDLVNDSDSQLIVTDRKGNHYLIEYGVGCIGIWRYEGKSIYIDIGGSYLDGLSDHIWLFGEDQDCKVWDGETIDTTVIPPEAPTTPAPRPAPRPLPTPTQLPSLPDTNEVVKQSGADTKTHTEDIAVITEPETPELNTVDQAPEAPQQEASQTQPKRGWLFIAFDAVKSWLTALFS